MNRMTIRFSLRIVLILLLPILYVLFLLLLIGAFVWTMLAAIWGGEL